MMKIRPRNRAWGAVLLSATTVVAIAGCTSARKTSTPQPADAAEPPKKEYQWKDMSTGKSFFKPIDPSSQN
jgi:hypothetical protein